MRPKTRSANDGPFCWQSKAALRRIREAFDATNDVDSALATYLALTETASNNQSETFTAAQASLSKASGVGVRTVGKHLKKLALLGLIETRPQPLAPSIYTLLAFGTGCVTLGNSCGTSGTECLPLGNGANRPVLPRFEESEKNLFEESSKNLAAGAASPSPPENRKTKTAPKPRERNPLWDALASVDGSNLDEMTRTARGRVGKALKDIKEVMPDVTAQEIKRRAAVYRAKHKDWPLTSSALAGRWAECGDQTTERAFSLTKRV